MDKILVFVVDVVVVDIAVEIYHQYHKKLKLD
jgi:hypothetical protein